MIETKPMKESLGLLLLCLLGGPWSLLAQYQTRGSAFANTGGGECFTVTPDVANRAGAVWSDDQVDLTEPQEWQMQVFLGCKDAVGADGMAFVLQSSGPNSLGGNQGRLGFSGIAPSIGIELDTWANNAATPPNYADLNADHLAVQANGTFDHAGAGNLAGPEPILGGGGNVEDCEFHTLRIEWSPMDTTLQIFFDCDFRLSYSGDIVSNIFNGDSLVYWGVTGATGGASNLQQVCFDRQSSFTQEYTLCQGDSLQPLVRPGNDFVWDTSPFLSNRNVRQPFLFPNDTSVFVVSYFDTCGVPITETITVNVIPAPPVNLPINDTLRLCAGEDSLLRLPALPPGTTLLWSDGSTGDSLLIDQPGIAWAEATLGCTVVRDSIEVLYDSIPQVDLGPDLRLCEDSTVQLDAFDRFANSYRWQDNSTRTTLEVSQPGRYAVTLTGLCGTATDTVGVSYDSLPRFELGPDPALCENEGRELDASSPFADRYQWQDGSTDTTFTVSQPGLYFAETENQCGTWRDSVTVSYDSLPTLELGADQNLCEGETFTLNPTTRYAENFLWFDGSSDSTYIGDGPGLVWLEVSNRCGAAQDSMVATYDSLPRFELGPDRQLCDDDSLRLDVSASADGYQWQDGSTDSTFLVREAGTYAATATNGCGTFSDSIVVTYDSLPQVDLGRDQNLCDGNTVTLDASWPGATITWTDGSAAPIREVTTSGTYEVTVSNSCGSANDVVSVEFLPRPEVDLGADDTVVCDSRNLLLDASLPNATYEWQDGSNQPTFNVVQEGTYAVVVSRAGCADGDTITVGFGIQPVVEIGTEVVLCDGQELPLDVRIPDLQARYQWSDNRTNPVRTLTEAGVYGITITNECGSVSDELTVITASTPVVDLGQDAAFCAGEVQVLDATFEQATYQWQDGSRRPTFTADTSGLYSVRVSTECGTVSDEVRFAFTPIPEVDLGLDTTICEGRSFRLRVEEGQGDITWQDGSSDPIFEVTEAGRYAVTIENDCGVADDDLRVETLACECAVYFPNAFTPDGDEYNDRFGAAQACNNLQNFQLRIYNRWGQQVFQGDSPDEAWDGTMKGRFAPQGVYAWVAEYTYRGAEGVRRDIRKGTVTLIR